jgi:hypothetical protein
LRDQCIKDEQIDALVLRRTPRGKVHVLPALYRAASLGMSALLPHRSYKGGGIVTRVPIRCSMDFSSSSNGNRESAL